MGDAKRPSAEAMELGTALFRDVAEANSGLAAVSGIAVALQRLMDERDEGRTVAAQACADANTFKVRAEEAAARLAAFDAWGKRGGVDYRQQFNDWVRRETNIETLRARLIAADEGGDYLHMCHVEQQERANKAESERDEAQGVAKVLARDVDICDREDCPSCPENPVKAAKLAALAYPDRAGEVTP